MPVLDPMVVDAWIRATLLATTGAETLVNGIATPADVTAFVSDRIYPGRDDFEPESWPFVVYSGSNKFTNYAEDVILADGDYLIRSFMRQDQIEQLAGMDVEVYNKQISIGIHAAFNGVKDPSALGGIVHGCQIRRPYRAFYGEVGRKVSEMGIVAHIWST